jgi:hypothetical protein
VILVDTSAWIEFLRDTDSPVLRRAPYDVSPDGKRFLMIKELDLSAGGALIYVQNWAEDLRRE